MHLLAQMSFVLALLAVSISARGDAAALSVDSLPRRPGPIGVGIAPGEAGAERGVELAGVAAGSAADKAGLQARDRIVEVAGRAITGRD